MIALDSKRSKVIVDFLKPSIRIILYRGQYVFMKTFLLKLLYEHFGD